MDKAKAYFQAELDILISEKKMFKNTKIEDIYFEPKDSIYYAKIVHGGDSAYWYIDKPTVDAWS